MKPKLGLLYLLVAIAVPTTLIAGASIGRSHFNSALAQQPTASLTTKAAEISLAGGRVTFVPPTGFTAMTSQEIAIKFPRGNPPQYVYANQARNVAVAITFSQARVTPEQLSEVQEALPSILAQTMPITKWITQAPTTINNRSWIRMEFISKAIDTKIHNDLYFTSFDGKLLGFNFNATVQQYAELKAELRKSRDSIIVK